WSPIMPKRAEPPEIADTSSLTDADWAAINVLKRAHALGGDRPLGQAVQALSKHDPGRYIRIMAAYFRDRVRETVKDERAGGELTIEDIREKLGEMLAMQEAELKDLAETLAQWVDAVPGFPLVYLFGSRVRGDHYKDSDVDVRLFLDEWKPIPDTLQW